MFSLLGSWPDSVAEAGVCLSGPAFSGRLQGGGLIEVCLPISASCLQKILHRLTGQDLKLTLRSHSTCTDLCRMTSTIVLPEGGRNLTWVHSTSLSGLHG